MNSKTFFIIILHISYFYIMFKKITKQNSGTFLTDTCMQIIMSFLSMILSLLHSAFFHLIQIYVCVCVFPVILNAGATFTIMIMFCFFNIL